MDLGRADTCGVFPRGVFVIGAFDDGAVEGDSEAGVFDLVVDYVAVFGGVGAGC